ncbi:MAG TPA: hypothetical protein PLT47_08050, partial [Bacteroidales bacterium]|nr:hypothetical protein [Bacteroidales bacterium]
MKKIFVVFVFSIVVSVIGFSQIYQGIDAQKYVKDSEMVRYSDKDANPAFIKYRSQAEPLFQEMDNWLKTTFNIKSNMGYMLIGTEKDKLGLTHYRYRQTKNGIPIRDAVFIV